MSEAIYNEQAMTDYLLGCLPEADVERYDELSIADDEFAAALSACEKDLVDAYVRGELAGGVLEQFRLHYLASPLRRDKVTFAKALQLFAERGAADVRSKDATDGGIRQGWFAAVSTFFAPRPALQWGVVAGVLLLLLAGGWFMIDNLRLRQQISQAQIRRDELQQREQALQQQLEAQHAANSKAERELAQVRAERELLDQKLKQQNGQERTTQTQPSFPGQTSIASFILGPGLRGAGQIQTLSIPPGTRRVALQLNLEPNDYQAYRVALIDQSNHQTLWQSGKLRARSADSGKALSVSFSSDLFKSQTYVMQVSGVSASGKTEVMSDYPFKVVK
jgi:hypothetical protein